MLSKINYLRFFAVLIVMNLFLSEIPSFEAAAENYNLNFRWSYGGRQWTWSLSVSRSLYDKYKSVPVWERINRGSIDYSFLTTTNDACLKEVADELHRSAVQMGYGSFDEVSFILAFVQSLTYTPDSVSSGYDEYPRFPVETLVDDGGDCEDSAILFATLVLILNYGAIYISPPNHCAVGVRGTGLLGTYWTYNGVNYYYCETTGEGFRIGDAPHEYEDKSAILYPVNTMAQYNPNLGILPHILVSNIVPIALLTCIILSIYLNRRYKARLSMPSP
jgi:hypothetical protein